MRFITKQSNTIICNKVLYGILSLNFDTYEKASEVLGVSTSSLIRCVNQGTLGNVERLKHISKVLGIPYGYLFNEFDIKKQITLKSTHPNNFISNEPEVKFAFREGVKVPRFRKATISKIHRPILYAIMIANDMKISEVAKKIGLTPRSVYSYVYGETEPKPDVIKKLEDLFEVQYEQLFYTKPIDGQWKKTISQQTN